MSTRGIIAKTTTNGWIGKYHHWDSYPSGLGQSLYKAYHQVFNGDIERMMSFLIDEHPAGWSTIVDKDLSLKPGFSHFDVNAGIGETFNKVLYYQRLAEYQTSEKARRAECYCHGDRHESEQTIHSLTDAWASWVVYAYIINEASHLMTIYARTSDRWDIIAKVELNGPEPDWKELN